VRLLPSEIGDRTLLSYEHGARQVTVLRLIELSQALGVPVTVLLGEALQRARLHLQNLVLRVDLRQLLQDDNNNYRPLLPWARNRLYRAVDGVVEVSPSGVSELAALLGRTHSELAAYLARFVPDDGQGGKGDAGSS
jgi:hypothetical protein